MNFHFTQLNLSFLIRSMFCFVEITRSYPRNMICLTFFRVYAISCTTVHPRFSLHQCEALEILYLVSNLNVRGFAWLSHRGWNSQARIPSRLSRHKRQRWFPGNSVKICGESEMICDSSRVGGNRGGCAFLWLGERPKTGIFMGEKKD
jgi:hypothetical protein